MAFDFSKIKFFSRLDARGRIFFLFAGLVGIIFVIYLATRYFAGGSQATGPSSVANVPAGLQSVPGGQLTPEYYNALVQANKQAAQQAQITGTSAVPTLLNNPNPVSASNSGQCNIICSDTSANVKYMLDDWVRQGKISPDISALLEQLADKNVPVDEFAQQLDDLVKQGKLTPEQARMLLEMYKRQHANANLQESAGMMDDLIKSGALPLDAANTLLQAQKDGISPAGYAALLQRLVDEGKISPATMQQLLAQYSQQRTREIIKQSISILNQMMRNGQITADVLKELVDAENKMIPIDDFKQNMDQYVSAGRLTPAVSKAILDEYLYQKSAIGPTSALSQMEQAAERDMYQEISDLLKAHRISQEVANQLLEMMEENVSLDTFVNTVNQLVQSNKLAADIAPLKIADYTKVKRLRDLMAQLAKAQANNATPQQIADLLKQGVSYGLFTPEQAAELMQQYRALSELPSIPTNQNYGNVPGTDNFAQLQQRATQGAPPTAAVTPTEFSQAAVQNDSQLAQERANAIGSLATAMANQATSLINAWQPTLMEHKEGGVGGVGSGLPGAAPAAANAATTATTTTTAPAAAQGAPLIKAGSILFAVLDTEVNSDYASSPVLATVVDGPYKGAKLLGTLVVTKSVSGQLDRVMLNFTKMNRDDWLTSKGITAYAIDPDTARSSLASSVDYHYMMRFGAIMATSFLQGYGNAITTSGSTQNTGVLVSTSHPELSPGNKIMTGFGQVGQTLGAVTQNYVNTPPTVRVAPGVGLGILFMDDVSS